MKPRQEILTQGHVAGDGGARSRSPASGISGQCTAT